MLTYNYSQEHPDSVLVFIYLGALSQLMTIPEVRLDRGTLTLGGVVAGAAVILLNPLDATLIGLITGVWLGRGGRWRIAGNTSVLATANCLASLVAAHFRTDDGLPLSARLAGLLILTAANLGLISTAIAIRTESPYSGSLARTSMARFTWHLATSLWRHYSSHTYSMGPSWDTSSRQSSVCWRSLSPTPLPAGVFGGSSNLSSPTPIGTSFTAEPSRAWCTTCATTLPRPRPI